jgi:hypothetical protein
VRRRVTSAIFREGVKNVTADANPMDIKKGIELAVRAALESIEKMSRPVEGKDIQHIGTISANNDEEIGTISPRRSSVPRSTSRKQLFALPDDKATKINIEFYGDASDALLKVLVE